ncbi:hypothetical protein Tco_0579613 [Tanacetum coccineum]
MRNMINLYTIRDDNLLGTLKYVSKTKDYLKYGALIPEQMINQTIKDSKEYKIYIAFATGKATPKKARKFKKIASPSKKQTLVLEEEPTKNPKRAKHPEPTKKDTPDVSVSKKKALATTDRSKGIDLLSGAALLEDAQMKKVHDELQDKTTGTNEGTESRDDDDSNYDDSDNVSDNDGNYDDSDDDGNNDASDDEDEYTTYDQVEGDAHVTLIAAHVTQKTEVLLQSSSVSFGFATQFLNLDNIPPTDNEIISMMNVDVRHEEPSNQMPLFLTVLVMKEAQVEKERYIDLIEKSVKDIINDEVKTQLPQILPKVVSDFTTPVIKSTITESLKDLDKDLFESYGKAYSVKRDRKDKDKDVDPSTGSDQGMKRRKTSKEVESSKGSKSKDSKSTSSSKGTTRSRPKSSGKSAQAEEPIHTVDDTGVQQNQRQDMGNTDDQPNVEDASRHDWFKKPERPPTLDSDWNIDNLTQEHLVGPTFNLLKGTCKRKEYPFDLSKPLPLIMDRGRLVILVDYFINNDLAYLRGGSSSKKYTTSTTKTNAAKYDIPGIEDMVPSL